MTNNELAGMLQELKDAVETAIDPIFKPVQKDQDGQVWTICKDVQAIMGDPELTHAQRLVLSYIYTHTVTESTKDVRQIWIEESLGIHRKTVREACWELRDLGIIRNSDKYKYAYVLNYTDFWRRAFSKEYGV